MGLGEYERFNGRACEIQVRSICQHAWAEIEHDLGYKSQIAVPKQIRRRFSRLAGLLEIADEEFAKLRDELASYEREVTRRLLARQPETVLIDQESMLAFMNTSEVLKEADAQLIERARVPLITIDQPNFRENQAAEHARALAELGYSTLGEIEKGLTELRAKILDYAEDYLGSHPGASVEAEEAKSEREKDSSQSSSTYSGGVVAGISLLYLAYVTALETDDVEVVSRLMEKRVGRAIDAKELAAEMLRHYRRVIRDG